MKIILFLLFVFSLNNLLAQTTMNIYITNGNVFSIPITDIDSVDYTNVGTGNCPTFVADIDGNIYNIANIGNQCWMKENLKTTHYKNGNTIPTGYSDAQWSSLSHGAYSYYNNNLINDSIYGKLYNWFTVADTSGLCPVNWHVPSDSEWTVLANYLGGSINAGGPMKEFGITHWAYPNVGASNMSGFTALPGGFRFYNGPYNGLNYFGYWWTSTQFASNNAYLRFIKNDTFNLTGTYNLKRLGFSVRCVKD